MAETTCICRSFCSCGIEVPDGEDWCLTCENRFVYGDDEEVIA